MMLAVLPTGFASADEHEDPPFDRGTEDVCDGDETAPFPDIDGNTHEANIACMFDYGLTEGRDDGTYGPRVEIRRDQMASFIARFVEDATDATLPEGDPEQFDDSNTFVGPHNVNIGKLAEAGIVSGFVDNTYRPFVTVNRQQMATFIRNAVSYIDNGEVQPHSEPPAWTGGTIFNDAPFVTAHNDNINSLAGVGIVQGNTAGNYVPTGPVFRDQMASFVMRAYDFVEAELPRDPDVVDPDGPTITESNVDTDVIDIEDDTGTASTDDVWSLTFSDDVDTIVIEVDGADTGATFTVSDGDDTYVVQCDVEGAGVDDGNFAAECDRDGDTVTITLLEDIVDGDGAIVEYPLTITDTDVTVDGAAIDFEAEGDFVLAVDADTDTVL